MTINLQSESVKIEFHSNSYCNFNNVINTYNTNQLLIREGHLKH